MNDAIRQGILSGSNSAELRDIAEQNGMVTLKSAGLDRVRQGYTSFEAALSVTGGE